MSNFDLLGHRRPNYVRSTYYPSSEWGGWVSNSIATVSICCCKTTCKIMIHSILLVVVWLHLNILPHCPQMVKKFLSPLNRSAPLVISQHYQIAGHNYEWFIVNKLMCFTNIHYPLHCLHLLTFVSLQLFHIQYIYQNISLFL